jgi:hypothetical protein
MSYVDYINFNGNGYTETSDLLMKKDDYFGDYYTSNIDIFTITPELYDCALAGIKAAEKYCRK